MPVGGKRPGAGRPQGARNKATVAREQADANSLREAQAALIAGVDLKKFEGITGLQVMRLAMTAHMQAGNLDKAAVWGEKIAPYETPKPVAKVIEPESMKGGSYIDGPPVAETMDEWSQRAKTRTPSLVGQANSETSSPKDGKMNGDGEPQSGNGS